MRLHFHFSSSKLSGHLARVEEFVSKSIQTHRLAEPLGLDEFSACAGLPSTVNITVNSDAVIFVEERQLDQAPFVALTCAVEAGHGAVAGVLTVSPDAEDLEFVLTQGALAILGASDSVRKFAGTVSTKETSELEKLSKKIATYLMVSHLNDLDWYEASL